MIDRLAWLLFKKNYNDAARIAMLAVLVATGLAVPTGRAAAQSCPSLPETVCNGGFELPPINGQAQTLPAGSSPTGFVWSIGGNSIDLVKNFWQAAVGSQSIDLDGNAPGSIAQSLVTKPGRSYKLTFKYSAHPNLGGDPARMTMRWGSTYAEPFVFTGKSTKSNMAWVTVERTLPATSTSTVLSFTSDSPSNNNYGVALDAVSAIELPPPLATPVLFRAVATGGTNALLIGRVDGASSLPITLQAYSAAACTDGVLVGGSPAGDPVPTNTDSSGYFGVPPGPSGPFGVPVTGVTPGYFVAVKVTAPSQTAMSTCLVSSADNDSWPKALQLADSSLLARDYIDIAGRARWYKFDVKPGQRIQIDLSQLPADYDLAVFKDIGAAFEADLLRLNTTDPAAELTKLGAEYAPSVFSPSVFSPSVFSPSVFSPDAYSPSVFSPSVFSPSVFSPSVFSPSVFSPSVFSPSVFSPSVFSPSVFSPSVFSPSVFSPSVFSPSVFSTDELAKAFSSAQTRSIIGVSATPGTGDELVVVNSWNNTGSFYVRVAGRAGAYSTNPTATSPTGQFQVNVAKGLTSCDAVTETALTSRLAAPGPGVKTVILTDSSAPSLAGDTALANKLAEFAASPEIGGVVVDVANTAIWGTRVQVLREQARNNTQCPYAMNLVAAEIKGIVDSYRPNNPGLRYVVIAGNDDVIPFFRYHDEAQIGQESGYVPPVLLASEASLRNDFVLSDAYGSGTQVSLRTISFPVPGLAVGRLVETPAEIVGMIDAYLSLPLTDGQRYVTPTSSLVTGYDFLADAANSVVNDLAAGTSAAVDTLITPNGKSPEDPASWTAAQLGTKLLGSRHDVIFLAGHFSANSALAADFATSLLATDLAASTVNLTNSIVFSAGCHSGYNLVNTDAVPTVTEKVDWVQAFAQKGATLIAGTGYQYGDTEFLEYSERLYANFARQLRAGPPGSIVAVGEALVKAKAEYIALQPDMRGIHEKAVLEATLFGLPMLGVNMPGARVSLPATGGVIAAQPVGTQPAQSLGLKFYDLALSAADLQVTSNPPLDLRLVTPNCNVALLPAGCTVAATWLSGPAGVVANAAEPALPLTAINVTPTDANLVLRGVGFRGGSYSDATVVALTGAPTTELRGVHVPFVSPVFYPMRTWNTNHFGKLAGTGGTSLLVTPAQHRAADIALGTSTRRTFSSLDLRLHYSGTLDEASLSDAPTIVRVDAQPVGGGIAFAAQVVGDPLAVIHQVWVTYTSDGANAWTSLDLVQCTASQPAACGTTQDSSVWKGSLPTSPPGLRYVVQAVNGYGLVTLDDNLGAYYGLGGAAQTATTLVLNAPPTGATFGDSPAVTATLTSGGVPLADKSVIVTVGGAARFGTTDANGVVAVNLPIVAVPGSYPIVASFGGDQTYLGSSASAPFAVGKATTSLAPLALPAVGVTLTAALGGPPAQTQRLLQEAVTFTVSGSGGSKTSVAITDYLGRAMLAPTGLPAGSYTISASFAGNTTYLPANGTQPFTIAGQTINFGGAGLPATLAYPGSVTFTVSSTSGQPVTVAVAPESSAYCTVSLDTTGTDGTRTYTLTAVAPGTCTLIVSADGTTTYASVTVSPNPSVVIPAIVTMTALASSANPSIVGQSVTFTATVQPASADFGTATGTVTFRDGATMLGAAPVTVVGGVATLVVPNGLGVGSHAITAQYVSANGTFQGSTSAALAQVVTIATTTTTVAPLSVSAQFGQNVSLTATVAVTAPGGGVPTGSVAFKEGATLLGSADLTGGTAPFTALFATNLFGVGPHSVTATYAGNASYAGSTSAASTVTIDKVITATALTTNMTTAPYGTPINLTATVTPANATGTVTFRDGATTLGTVALTSGSAAFTASGLTIGTHSLSATYSGDANDAPSTSAALNVVIKDVFVATGPMLQARINHTSTLLNDGRVLVTGGYAVVNGAATRTAEIYCPDPYTPPAIPVRTLAQWCPNGVGKFSRAGFGNTAQVGVGNLVQSRAYHTATLLPADGTVLLAGGFDATGAPTATSELYDPAADRFTATGNMPSKSAGHTATLITKNGRATVFVAGGGNASSQVFDSVTKNWSPSGGMSAQRSYHTATLVGTTKVLLAGGVDNANKTLQTTTLYDIGTGSFMAGPTLLAPRERHGAAAIANGKVLLAGGRSKTGNNYSVALGALAEIYDPANATTPFSAVPFASGTGRYSHGATALIGAAGLPDGRVLVTGGATGSTCGQQLAASEMFTVATFAADAPMIAGRLDHTATVLKDGRVLVAGGTGAVGSGCGPLSSAEVWIGPSP